MNISFIILECCRIERTIRLPLSVWQRRQDWVMFMAREFMMNIANDLPSLILKIETDTRHRDDEVIEINVEDYEVNANKYNL